MPEMEDVSGCRQKWGSGARRPRVISEIHQQVTKSHSRMGGRGWCFAHKMQNLSTIRKIPDFGSPGAPQKVGRIPSP